MEINEIREIKKINNNDLINDKVEKKEHDLKENNNINQVKENKKINNYKVISFKLNNNILNELAKINNEIKKAELKKYEKLNELTELKKEIFSIRSEYELYIKMKEINQLKYEISLIESERLKKIFEIKELIAEDKYKVSGEQIVSKWFANE